jgi:hypothetical protein
MVKRIAAVDWLRGLGAALILGAIASLALPTGAVVAIALAGGVAAMVPAFLAARRNLEAHPPVPAAAPPTSAERFMRAVKTVGDFKDQANRWYLSEQPMPSSAWDVLCDELLDWANTTLEPETAERLAELIRAASPQAPTSDSRRNAGTLVGSLLDFQRTLTSAEVL